MIYVLGLIKNEKGKYLSSKAIKIQPPKTMFLVGWAGVKNVPSIAYSNQKYFVSRTLENPSRKAK